MQIDGRLMATVVDERANPKRCNLPGLVDAESSCKRSHPRDGIRSICRLQVYDILGLLEEFVVFDGVAHTFLGGEACDADDGTGECAPG